MQMAGSNSRVQITIAFIGLAGVVLAAVISNWNNFGKSIDSGTQISSGSNSPNISAKGDVSVNISGDKPAINAAYLSQLVGKEPFLESLPAPLLPGGFSKTTIGDPSAASRLGAVRLDLLVDPVEARKMDPQGGFSDLQTYAHIEIYKNKNEALNRFNGSKISLVSRYPDGVGVDPGNTESFCVNGSPSFWTCIGSRGFIYSEVTLSPGSNANLGLANGVLAAMLRYGDKMTSLATSRAE
jgi:hypothetical protein